MEKICFKCNVKKPLDFFYAHPAMKDGHLNKCKECNKKDVSKNYETNKLVEGYIEKERKRGRKKYHRLYVGKVKNNDNEKLYKKNVEYHAKYPEKRIARLRVANIIKPFDGAESHHWSYNEEHYKDVIFLSKKEHSKAHRFIIYDQEQMMYRRYDNNILLDTKEAHELFIKECIETKED